MILICILLIVLFLFVYSFISDIISHNKKMKTIKEFNNICLDCINQVSDRDIKISMSYYILSSLTNKNYNVEEIKSDFYQKFGKYIPEIVTENRDKKINNILNGTDLSKM